MLQIGFWEILSLYLLSAVKFLFAPFLGLGYQISPLIVAIICYAGGLTGTLLFTFLGKYLIRFWAFIFPRKKPKLFTPKARKYVRMWQKFGFPGIAFLSPVTISLPVGVFLMLRFGTPERKIMYTMAFTLLFWAIVLSFGGSILWNQLPDFLKNP